ncbi:hypothetical protein [Streptomyces flavofungini]|uniref:hypothetical protein n=1 Tax=Streptomyces flavofungini TaxID=68200 RepID=UPI0034DFF47C
MDAVLETHEAVDFALWPVADLPADRLLALSGRLSPPELGTAMAVLACYNNDLHKREAAEPGADAEAVVEQVRGLVSAECVMAPGGLRVRDTATGVTVPPGCCFGLENWRDWLDLLDGAEPWLGHDPTPRVEHVGATVRLWPDEDRPDAFPIDLPLARLPVLMRSVQDQLADFLASVEEWATRYAPPLAATVVAKLDGDLAIGAPLRKE